MATFYITEYAKLAKDYHGHTVPCPQAPHVAKQQIAIPGSSAAFGQTTHFVTLHTDSICAVDVGTEPDATANPDRFAANETRFIGVNPGDKIAVVTAA